MIEAIRLIVLVALGSIAASSPSWADCASDCSAAYRSCSGNPDTCLSQQGVCPSRCGLEAERHGAIVYSPLKNVDGYSCDFGASSVARRFHSPVRPRNSGSICSRNFSAYAFTTPGSRRLTRNDAPERR